MNYHFRKLLEKLVYTTHCVCFLCFLNIGNRSTVPLLSNIFTVFFVFHFFFQNKIISVESLRLLTYFVHNCLWLLRKSYEKNQRILHTEASTHARYIYWLNF